MQIELTIAGLCMLAEDDRTGCVHVLLPATGYDMPSDHGQSHHHHHPPHIARFVYPLCSDQLSDEVTGYSFDLGGLVVPSPGTVSVPPEVFDIRYMDHTHGIVDKHDVDGKNPTMLASVVTLRGGTLTFRDRECCDVNGTKYLAAAHTVWRAQIAEYPPVLAGKTLCDTSPTKFVCPPADDGVVHLGLVHSTVKEMPATLDALHQTFSNDFDHFTAFYPLVKRHGNDIPTACEIRGPSQCMPARARVR